MRISPNPSYAMPACNVFADHRHIRVLKTCAMELLHAALADFTLYKSRTVDIVALRNH